jgi:hypothetical protein
MTGEGYNTSIDQYYYNNNNRSSKMEDVNVVDVEMPVSIEKSTPCIQSYCTARPEATKLVNCLCYNNNNTNTNTNGNSNNTSTNGNINNDNNSNSNGNNNYWTTLPTYNNNNKN